MVKVKKPIHISPKTGSNAEKKVSSVSAIKKPKLMKLAIKKKKEKLLPIEKPIQRTFRTITSSVIRSAIIGTNELIKQRDQNKTPLFDDQKAIFLQITAVQVPECPFRILRLPLTHSLLDDDCQICLIVPDVPHIPRKETERVVEHYEEILQSKGVTNIKTIMPFYQLKTEYDTFELKRRLVELYDLFLVDGKISGFVVHKLGNIFINKRKLPIPVKLDGEDFKSAVEKAMKKSVLNMHGKGDSYIVQVGHSQMDPDDVVDNTFSVLEVLEKEFPGNWANIRNLHFKGATTTSIPIYVSLKSKDSVDLKPSKANRPKAYKAVTDDLSTMMNTEVTVLPSGRVRITKLKPADQILCKYSDNDKSDSDESADEALEEEHVPEKKSKRVKKAKK